MEETIKKLGDIEIKKQNFHQHDRTTSIKNIDIDKTVVSNKCSFGKKKGFKYFIGYKDVKKFIPLCISLPKMSVFRRDYDETIFCFDKKS